MPTPQDLLENNKRWAEETVQHKPGFFTQLACEQRSDFLWIGCSDSRVPPSNITGQPPGGLFVHRNIANLVVSTDTNLMAVLQYAVTVLQVKHILIVGHYGCGGVQAAMEQNNSGGFIDTWLEAIRDTARRHAAELDACKDHATRFNRLCELNVLQQAENLRRTGILQEAWADGREVAIHSWIYSLSTGLLRPLRDPIATPAAE
ncbi:MAG: carbonic anhydrase [Opitutales bacterium]